MKGFSCLRKFFSSVIQCEKEYTDVLIVGGGPSGLSAAIKLKQIAKDQNKETRIVLLDKGAEIGSHILSGAVLEPRALDELLPDWRLNKFPIFQPVTRDRMLFLTKNGQIPLPKPPQMHNTGNFIISLSDLCKYLSEVAESLGVEIYPGVAGSTLLYDSEGSVTGIETHSIGIDKNNKKTDQYQPGIHFIAKNTLLAEGCRGSLTKEVEKKFKLRKSHQFQTYGLGLKEIWNVDPKNYQPGIVIHTVGWPLPSDTYGGSFLYHSGIENRIYLGMVVGLDYSNPFLSPYQEFQRWKHHPAISSTLKNGQCISYGARALNEGGFQSIPTLFFPGGLLIGCAAGFLNVPKIKGTHTAMKSGIIAAEAIMDSNSNPSTIGPLYENMIRQSWLWEELYQVRNIRPSFKYGLISGLFYSGFDTIILRGKAPWTFSHHSPDHLALKESKNSNAIVYPKPDNKISFPLLENLARSGTNHDENQPSHLKLTDNAVPVSLNLGKYAGPESKYCPANVYEFVDDLATGQKRLQINAPNCLHCKTCDIKDPSQNITWVTPHGGDGPNYSGT